MPLKLAAAAVILVVAYGALLRFDALTLKYGPVERPTWLRTLQKTRAPQSPLRPARVTWDPVSLVPHRDGTWTKYGSDPYTYLQYAREMKSFYAAHRREPLFPFVTKAFLWLLDQQDVAVSFASASFSVLAILLTFLVGAAAFSYWVGLGAALAMAVEYDVVSWSVGGWRDDAFTFSVLLFTLALLWYRRVPILQIAVAAGIAGGVACLIRITALSFVVPGFLWMLMPSVLPRDVRLRNAAAGALMVALLVGPFLFNCWRVYGDPFHAINVHADVYRAAEGQAVDTSQTAREYLQNEFRTRPVQTLDTVILGMTSYPFLNKWKGFDAWIPAAGTCLLWAALAGLLLFTGSGHGRLILLLLAASLVPYAATWRLISDWRFTEHAYPFFLLGSFFAIAEPIRLALPRRAGAPARARPTVAQAARWAAVLAGTAIGVWLVVWLMPLLTVREALRSDERVTIMAGGRDFAFFAEGWSRPATEGMVTSRASQGSQAVIRLPLPVARDYSLTLRMDPVPRPSAGTIDGLPSVRLFMNGDAVATIAMAWNPDRVGAYEVRIPGKHVRVGLNRLAFVIVPASARYTAVRLWYVRIGVAAP